MNGPSWQTVLLAAGCLLPITAWCAPEEKPMPAEGDAVVTGLLASVLREHPVPALGAAIVTSQDPPRMGVAGFRKTDATTPVTLADQWHLGSLTKAMTATLAARLVEQGVIAWDSPAWPPEGGKEEPPPPTLARLLRHQSGLPANLAWGDFTGGPDLAHQRQLVLEEARKRLAPGGKDPGFLYSNLGYVVAGAMLEHASGNTWETLMEEQFFRPLGMKRTGVGGTGTEGKTDQPWPHDANGRPMPHNGPAVDNPPVMGPAGTVHAPLADWAAFVTDQLRGARGQEALLRKESYHIIQKPDRGRYAMGWQTEDRDWGGGPVLTHAGTNTMNYAVVWMAPLRDFAVLVATNQGGEDAWRAVDSAAGKLIGWLQERRPPTNPTNPTNPADP